MSCKVWIPKLAGHNYDEAKKFGELKVILGSDVSPFNLDRIEETMRIALQESDSQDYVIPAGPPIINMLLIKNWPHNVMKILLFHARTRNYIYREIYL